MWDFLNCGHFFVLQVGGERGLVGLSHEYKVCKWPHIHKKLQPKKISIPIALFRLGQNTRKR